MNVLNVPSGNNGKMLNFVKNTIDAFNAGYNAAGAVQNTSNENKDSGDTTLYNWKEPDIVGTQVGVPIKVSKNKDSIEHFNKTHKTQPD